MAVIEIAAAGIELVAPHERDVLGASTFGVGELISPAMNRGATDLLIGLGGSATNDGGAEVTALGGRFNGVDGRRLAQGGAALAHLHQIDPG